MPTFPVFLVRLVWVASQFSCLFCLDAAGRRSGRYRWFTCYLLCSALLGVCYWPELDGWHTAFYPYVLAVTLLRTVAMIEAIHWQTERFPHWGQLMGAAIVLAFAGAGIIWMVGDGLNIRDWAIQVRRPLQVFTALLAFVPFALLWRVGWLRNRQEDRHALVLGAICLAHAAVSLGMLYVQGHPLSDMVDKVELWSTVDLWATVFDSGCYICWAAIVPGKPFELLRAA